MWEWMETAYDGINNTAGEGRELRGGRYSSANNTLADSYRDSNSYLPTFQWYDMGFRVASVPEPSTGLLVVLGLGGLLLKRRK